MACGGEGCAASQRAKVPPAEWPMAITLVLSTLILWDDLRREGSSALDHAMAEAVSANGPSCADTWGHKR